MSGKLQHVNVLQGTDSRYDFSRGNTLPLTAVPFGMNHWSLETKEDRWFFDPHCPKLQGFRLTHQPSPWIGDYGALVFMPQTGRRRLRARERAASYRLAEADLSPASCSVVFREDLTRFRLAPTVRGAVMEAEASPNLTLRMIVQPAAGESFVEVIPEANRIVGWTKGSMGGALESFCHYYIVEFSHPFTAWTLFDESVVEDSLDRLASKRAASCLEFGEIQGALTARIATSFISLEQASLSFDAEVAGRSFTDIQRAATDLWESALSSIDIEDEDAEAVRTFYSCLYRTQLFPRVFHEVAADGSLHHYSPFSGKVHPGVAATDNGFWDTYRTEYPLLALLNPAKTAEILQGWVNASKEGGWFPQWASPGYRACMVGTHIDAVVADGISRGVTDFDIEGALDGMLKHAYEPGDPDGAWGRVGIEDYKTLGWVAHDRHHESVCRTLDYAYDDWCIAQVARRCGRTDEAASLEERSKTWRTVFDPEVGFMRGRLADGSWLAPWNPYAWGSPYVEGGPWQSSWGVQHDIPGLIGAMGGAEAFCGKLDQMLHEHPHADPEVYGFELHEATEMIQADFGQYAHSNQPVHHVLYLYTPAGKPWRTAQEVRRVMDELYSPHHLPGDEDNGEMSAWYVLSALGIFPLCPGDGTWTLGIPRFKTAKVGSLTIRRVGEGARVKSIELDGKTLDGFSLLHSDLKSARDLTFRLGPAPG